MVIVVLLSYIVGSIPTSVMPFQVEHGFDIRSKGSGNAGGTNVSEYSAGKSGCVRIISDGWKVSLRRRLLRVCSGIRHAVYNHTPFDDFTIIQMICGAAAVIGHVWTMFAGFKGGRVLRRVLECWSASAPTEFAVFYRRVPHFLYAFRYVSLGPLWRRHLFRIAHHSIQYSFGWNSQL